MTASTVCCHMVDVATTWPNSISLAIQTCRNVTNIPMKSERLNGTAKMIGTIVSKFIPMKWNATNIPVYKNDYLVLSLNPSITPPEHVHTSQLESTNLLHL